MSELVEFLLARIADDEERATFVQSQVASNTAWPDPEPWRLSWQDEYDLLCIEPSRVLAECEAKRRIVEELAAIHPGDQSSVETWRHAEADVCRLLALPYADHADFRDEWRP